MTIRFLNLQEFAERIGVKRATAQRYKLPKEDALTGTTRGWLPQTVDAWNAKRPGRGNRRPGWENSFDPSEVPDNVVPIKTKVSSHAETGHDQRSDRPGVSGTERTDGKPPAPHFTG